ncbi:MAG: lamin tail domain-containing protein [Planctomycetes bacterium]|nr:lamin tail domain-containing protein [Planctomycetota bacterium]
MLALTRKGFWRRPVRVLIAASLAATAQARLAAAVISEIHYNPRTGEEGLEFIELTNDLTTPEDISGYSFAEGIVFTVPPATVLGPRGSIVICADASAVKARYGIQNAIGNYEGRLDSSGDRVTLVNHAGARVQSVRYRTRGSWPVGPDGTGHTLALRSIHLDASEPESWAQSLEIGGTPGQPNFPGSDPRFEERVVLAAGVLWRYVKGTEPFSSPETAWRSPTFDDASWLEGPTGIGYGDGDDATVLDDMMNNYVTVAARKRFTLSAADLQAAGDYYLAINYDDGFCAWLNGSEVGRANCGNPGQDLAWNAIATGSREAGAEDLFPIDRAVLRSGENVLAVVGHNFNAGSSDFSLIPRVLNRRRIDPGSPGSVLPVSFNELLRGASPGAGWVEIHNAGASSPADVSGHTLTDDPERPNPYVLPPGSVIPASGFLVVDEAASGLAFTAPEVQLFLLAPDGRCITAAAFDRAAPPGSAPGAYSEARFPDGGPLEWTTLAPTRGAPNQVARRTDIVLNEIFYHPPEERAGEFVELFNRGSSAVDLSGFRFTKGIDFTIPDGTMLGPGAYLVIAEDPALIQRNYGASALGPYQGQLADDGENVRLADRAGNLVDEVRYHEGGAWSQWADGGGASLELIDPEQDNSAGSAWDASDETAKTAWERLSFTVPSYAVAGESELHLYLVAEGVCRIDDVSITRAGGANHIPNPGFETSTSGWLIQGTHVASRRITTDKHSGNACLELSASSKGDILINRIEIETSPRMTAGAYDVSLWARWVRGATVLVAHGEYTAGAFGGRPSPAVNLSGNSMSAGLRMTVPWDIGTPGAENSVRSNLRAATGSGNLGPVISEVVHSPPSPRPSESANVTARVSDSGGVSRVDAFYRTGDANGAFTAVQLFDDGLHSDGGAGDGVYGGGLPGQGGGTFVVHYVEATDAAGAKRRFPVDAPAHTHLFQVQGPVNASFDTGRIVLDVAHDAELRNRPLHSNDLVDAAFVFNDEEVYYSVGVRYRGSPWGRPGRSNFRVRFPADEPFLRGREAVNLDNSGPGPNEGAAYFLVARNSSPSKPSVASEYAWLRTQYNGGDLGYRGLLQRVDRDLLNDWYGSADLALALKVEGRRQFNDAGDLAGWDGASFIFRGERETDKESYRNYFIPGMRQSVDDWTALIGLAKVMDARRTPNATFDGLIDQVLDVDAFFRVLAPRILQADWDAFCIGNGHNGYLVLDPTDDRWELLPHDMDNTFGNPNAGLFPTADPDVVRLMARPGPRRTYFRVLWEATEGYWWSQGSAPYFNAVQAATGIGFGGILGYLDSSRASVRTQVQSSVNVPLRITTNSGRDITTDQTTITLGGDAPITMASLFYQRSSDPPAPLEATWSTTTKWSAVLYLPSAENPFEVLGFDAAGDLLGSARITIRSTARPTGPVVSLYFPDRGTVAGGTLVTFTGQGFAPELKVLFGGVESTEVTVLQEDTAQAVVPPAPYPPPADGKVDIEVILGTGSTRLPKAFTYTIEGGFVRGDATNDRQVDIADPVAVLFHLFRGLPILCQDAADVDDSGTLNITDVVLALDYLFRNGAPPARPFPARGLDPTADGLTCVQ